MTKKDYVIWSVIAQSSLIKTFKISVFRETIDALKNIGDKDYYPDLRKVKVLKAKEKVSDQHALRFLLKFHTIITAYALDLKNEVNNNTIVT